MASAKSQLPSYQLYITFKRQMLPSYYSDLIIRLIFELNCLKHMFKKESLQVTLLLAVVFKRYTWRHQQGRFRQEGTA